MIVHKVVQCAYSSNLGAYWRRVNTLSVVVESTKNPGTLHGVDGRK